MKKILIGLGVLLLVFIVLFFFKAKKSNDDVENMATSTPESGIVQNSSVSGAGAVKSSGSNVSPTTSLATNLFPQKGSYQCTYEQATQTSRSTNTVYIADGRIRAEFRSKDAQGFGTLSMMVYDGTYLYSWVEGQAVGTRTRPTSVSQIPIVVPTDIHEGKVLGSGINNVSWDCHAWTKVSSMLSKPSYVKF